MEEQTDFQNKELYIEVLGGFSISYQGKVYVKDSGSSKKVMNLLQYLIINRKNKIIYENIIHALKIDSESKNPSAVLKNLVYRARMLLKTSGLPNFNYIIQEAGSYTWNESIPCYIDAELLENYYNQAKKCVDIEDERVVLYEKAIQIYGGKFLPRNASEIWIIPLNVYYDKIFKECLNQYFALMKKRNDYESIIRVCKRVIDLDSFDEKAYVTMIDSYCYLKKFHEALAAYEKITDLLYDELGVKPSEQLLSLYEKAMGQLNSVESNLIKIDNSLRELSEEVNGAFYCNLGLFKSIFQFLLRMFARTGQSLCMVIFTISDRHGGMPKKEKRVSAMGYLKECIASSLRSGDIFAKYSPTQYLVLLVGASYENSGKVAERILDCYQENASIRAIQIKYKVKIMEIGGS